MRVILKAQIPVERGSAMIRDGSMGKSLQRAMDELKPEAAYFFADDGVRTAMFVFDMADSSEMVQRGELFFGEMQAKVTLSPVMNLEDLRRGLGNL